MELQSFKMYQNAYTLIVRTFVYYLNSDMRFGLFSQILSLNYIRFVQCMTIIIYIFLGTCSTLERVTFVRT